MTYPFQPERLYSALPFLSDEDLDAGLDFVGRARDAGSWDAVNVHPPVVLGSLPLQLVPDGVREEAVRQGVVHSKTVEFRGNRLEDYTGRGGLWVQDHPWYVIGDHAHENRNHDFVAGCVRGAPICPVDLKRCAERARLHEDAGRMQLALTLGFFAGASLERFTKLEANDALDEVFWRMARAKWLSLEITKVIPDELPFFARIFGTVPEGTQAVSSLQTLLRRDGVSFEMLRVPRLGAATLVGEQLSLPGPGAEAPD